LNRRLSRRGASNVYRRQNGYAEASAVCLINRERAANGAGPVARQDQLMSAAADITLQAITDRWWGPGIDPHVNPNRPGSGIGDRVVRAGYCPNPTSWAFGEIATYQATPAEAVAWWMGSPGHRALLLNPAFRDVGISAVPGNPSQSGPTERIGTFVATLGFCN